jgi:hypothetical protein
VVNFDVGHHPPPPATAVTGMPDKRTRHVASLVPAACTAAPMGNTPAALALTMACPVVLSNHTAAPSLILAAGFR